VAALALLGIAGLLDQTSERDVPDYRQLAAADVADGAFVRQVEQHWGDGTLIFQLPYVPFPEQRPVSRMADYDHLRPFLHSRALRWSYGAIRGGRSDEWQRQVAAGDPDELLGRLALAGFGAVYVDRRGYTDAGEQIVGALADRLGAPLVGPGGRLALFDLRPYAATLRGSVSVAEWAAKRAAALAVVRPVWKSGVWPWEGAGERSWRWARATAELELENGSPDVRDFDVEMVVATGRPGEADLRLESPVWTETFRVSEHPRRIVRRLTIPPGRVPLRLVCDAPPLQLLQDPRPMVFRLERFRVLGRLAVSAEAARAKSSSE
jgi:phosphoglycerol transferase